MKTNDLKKTNIIGIELKKAEKLSKELNHLLANYQLFYQNTRGFHWNIKGEKFFELHLKFEELYNNFQIKIDEIAERILTLGFVPLHSFTDYLKEADFKEENEVTKGKEAVKIILESLKTLITHERKILEISGDAGDEGTNALMSDYIREQEKLSWMYAAYLG